MMAAGVFPPVFFYIMDPKLDAIERAKKGISMNGVEEDSWNRSMPMSKADKRRDLVHKVTIGLFGVVFGLITVSMGF